MKLLLLTCARDALVDRFSNALSIISVIEEIAAVSFPLRVDSFVIAALIERHEDEPEDAGLRIRVSRPGQRTEELSASFAFEGRQRTRVILRVNGLVCDRPGELKFEVRSTRPEDVDLVGFLSLTVRDLGTKDQLELLPMTSVDEEV